ncbi:MAG: RidA family protein [Candidatus Methylacidiphilales bacterium]
MPAPSGNIPQAPQTAAGERPVASASWRLSELGIVLPTPPVPLGAYVAASETGGMLFLSGMLPLVDRKLVFSGRLGEGLTVEQGQEAARLASLNALAVAQQYLGSLDRLRKLVKLKVLMVTTEDFTQHAAVGDGASHLFAEVFGSQSHAGHVRVVYGVQSMPLGSPVMVETVFEITPP